MGYRLPSAVLLATYCALASIAAAATISGNATLQGQSDHSPITVSLLSTSSVPSLTFWGVLILLTVASMVLMRQSRKSQRIAGVVSLVLTLAGFAYASVLFTTNPEAGTGDWRFSGVGDGTYSIEYSASGYTSQTTDPVIVSGNVTLTLVEDIVLVSAATVTPTATASPTQSPTQSPTSTPTHTPTQSPTPTLTPDTSSGGLYTTDSIVGNLRYIPGGTYTQGSSGAETCRGADETQFTHTLSRDLVVMETEVTRQMWSDLNVAQTSLPDDPTSEAQGSGMMNPAQNNTWMEAILFANLLSLEQGFTRCYYTDSGFNTPITAANYETGPYFCNFDADGFRLLSEGEWEYVCRAGTTTPFYTAVATYNVGNCGNAGCVGGTHSALEAIAWFCGNGASSTQTVGSKTANIWNLRDTHGNVAEWCWDWYATYPTGPETDYEGSATGSARVTRGGAYNFWPRYTRSAFRTSRPPSQRSSYIGFRLARTID